MHRGRSYPFLPNYWTAPAWFWPGWVPWKLVLDGPGASSGPWAAVGALAARVSNAGIPDLPGDSVAYQFDLVPGPAGLTMTVTLYRGGVYPDLSAEWYASLVPAVGVGAIAFATQSYPQTVVDLPTFTSAQIAGSGLPCAPPDYHARPASYAEGGSPWA